MKAIVPLDEALLDEMVRVRGLMSYYASLGVPGLSGLQAMRKVMDRAVKVRTQGDELEMARSLQDLKEFS